MRRFYPDMRRVAFISDNTYGGLSMQALVKKEMEKYPDLETIWLDGRTETFMEVSEGCADCLKIRVYCWEHGVWTVRRVMLLVIRLICCVMRILPCLCLLSHLWDWDIGHWEDILPNTMR